MNDSFNFDTWPVNNFNQYHQVAKTYPCKLPEKVQWDWIKILSTGMQNIKCPTTDYYPYSAINLAGQ